jgi:hypothetical protein
VDEAPAVRVGESFGNIPCDLDRVIDGELALTRQALAQRFSLEVGHYVVKQSISLTGIMQRQDVRVREPGGGGDFAKEPLDAHGRGQFGVQHLQGNVAAVLHVTGEIHRRHAAPAEFTFDGEAAREGGLQAGEELGQANSGAGMP